MCVEGGGGGGIKAKVFDFFGSYLVSSISAQYNFFCGGGGVDFFSVVVMVVSALVVGFIVFGDNFFLKETKFYK